MSQTYLFDDQDSFLAKLHELASGGATWKTVRIRTPYPVHGMETILKAPRSGLWKFTAAASLAGLLSGFAFTIYTVREWPLLITGGKPMVSLPPFTIIAFELTILFGAVVSFLGYLLLSGQPSIKNILEPEEYGNRFAILVEEQK